MIVRCSLFQGTILEGRFLYKRYIRYQGGDVIFNRYLKKEKWGIVFFLIGYIALFIISYCLIGGPVSSGGPIGVFIGFCIVQFLKYRAFKKDEENKKGNSKGVSHRF
ncbi:hypothetical protein [Bacillus safensis]|uniref:hypothetical protein n=1 Tax=Bacillus safensis TaxID=561879 RepID=UPI002DD41E11|nr:hypothetical protein [Bacillus safensis]